MSEKPIKKSIKEIQDEIMKIIEPQIRECRKDDSFIQTSNEIINIFFPLYSFCQLSIVFPNEREKFFEATFPSQVTALEHFLKETISELKEEVCH